MSQDSSSNVPGSDVNEVLYASQAARQVLRIVAQSEPVGEYDLYDKYMTRFGAYQLVPNPKGEAARAIEVLIRMGMLREDRDGSYSTSADALGQLRQVPSNDLTVDMIESAGYRSLVSETFIVATSISCSTSTSCKCTSSSSSSASLK